MMVIIGGEKMTTKILKDNLGREVEYSFPPKRIVSLCPGITDTLFSLNLENEIVGRTRYCIYPRDKVKEVQVVGGTKEIKMDLIHQLNPDLIIAEKEENTKEIVDEISQHYPVYVVEVQSVNDAFGMIQDMGEVTDRKKEATSLVEKIKGKFDSLSTNHGNRVGYVIWKKPYMVVGNNTYINSQLQALGFTNPFTELNGRYPVVTIEELQQVELDYLFLATEPYPFKVKHIDEFKQFLPTVKFKIVDGEMFWYGPRMLEAAGYFKKILNEIT
jgi:iron complex transport system substrate-binding protein